MKQMNKRRTLGQFYTPDLIAKYVISGALGVIDTGHIRAIELSAGNGRLLSALKKQLPSSDLFAVDIDYENTKLLKSHFPKANILNRDGIAELGTLKENYFELGLGNPPFIKIMDISKYHKKITLDYLNMNISNMASIRAEIIFVAQYFRLLKQGGVLAIILPDSILVGEKSEFFRKSLLNLYEIISIHEIDPNVFEYTEAKTHLILIRKSFPTKKNVKLARIGGEGADEKPIFISPDSLISRMDYSYHVQFNKSYQGKKLSELATITRGKYTHKDLKSMNCEYIHTTNFLARKKTEVLQLLNSYDLQKSVTSGDILMCRVGSRCVGNTLVYKGEDCLFSDCIYRIRFSNRLDRNRFWKFISSKKGQKTLKALSRGVCSQYLTISDLKSIKF